MPDNLYINQVPACPGGTIYTIIPGDAYYVLARRFNTTIDALVAANPDVDPNNLQIGQQICIPVPSAGTCPGGFAYVIRAGDTFYALARRYGTVVPALIAANPTVDPNQLAIGQTICVPAPAPGPTTCPNGRLYTIVAGDTLFRLARRFRTTVTALLNANPGLNPNSLQIGQQICIPL